MSYIEFKNVCKEYKMGEIIIKALDNTNFSIEKGELVVIVGPSGAGKTTTLNILGGMDNATSGEVIVDGKQVTKLKNKQLIQYRREDIGFVFQFYNLVQNLTAKENVELATQICKNSLNPEEVIKKVGLKERMNNFPSQLSGGEQQRIAIARAIAKNPKLLLCDEPTGALDYKTGKQILKLLQDTARKENMITINDIKTKQKTHLKEGEICLTDKVAQLLGVKAGDIIILRDNDNTEKEVKISTEIMNNKEVATINRTSITTKALDDTMKSMNYIVLILIVSAGLLAFVVLYNLANVNISEKIRELATIKVLGFYDKEVYDYVTRETILLTLIGVLLGLIGGYYLNYFIIGTCELNMFRFCKVIEPISYLYAVLITIGFTAIVNLMTYFALKKINMIESLKSVE